MTSSRNTRRRFRRGIALLGVCALVLGACGDDDDTATDEVDTTAGADGAGDALSQWQEDGVVMGIANERPYGYEEDGEATGEAPELAREVFDRLGIDDVEYVPLEFGALVNGLNAGRLDVIAAGMFINPDRAANVLFTDPDYCATTAFAVPEGNPDDLSDYQSVIDSGATIAVLQQRGMADVQTVSQQLHTALESRIKVEQAKGMIAQATGARMGESFEILRRHARSRSERVADVAAAVIAGDLAITTLTNP